MKPRVTPLLCWLIAAASLLITRAPAHAQAGAPIDSTHYWSYRVLAPPPVPPSGIAVSDQFFQFPIPETVDHLDRLVNWVYKNNSTVLDTFIHYTWWNLVDKFPVSKSVVVSNQFGTFPVSVDYLDFLLVPAWKNQPRPAPPHANHYLCYRAHGFPSPPQSYFLHDEWRADLQHPGPMEFLCVPCMKNHAGQIFMPVDTVTHLAVYPIAPSSDYFYPLVLDQFFQGYLYVQQQPIEYLFVPSTKFEVSTGTKRGTWGQLKTLYR